VFHCLNKIEVRFLAEETFGVRSMAVLVKTPELTVLLDAGVSLAPRRFGLPPHPEEFKAVKRAREKILEAAKIADIVTVSHYHLDHYTPSFKSWYEWSNQVIFEKIYGDKTLLIKSPEENINFNQRKRAHAFLKSLQNLDIRVEYADSRSFGFMSTEIKVSPPLPHGPEGSKLGWVLLFTIKRGSEKIVFAPDVQGPISQTTLNYIISERPKLLIIGGPPIYLAGRKVKQEEVEKGI